MLTARAFADKYPGELVKPVDSLCNEISLPPGTPIGIVVGFRPGQKGVLGSSKVAIWRQDLPQYSGLNLKTNRDFKPIILDPPAPTIGIYFLSVNQIELVNPRKELKPITLYSKHCDRCGSPCRKGKWVTICSNSKCKTNKIAIQALGPFPIIKEVDKEGYVLCPFCQKRELEFGNDVYNERNNRHNRLICCANKNHRWLHTWKEKQKMSHKGLETYYWDKKSGLKR